MLGEVLADALAETLREAIDRPGVEGHRLLGLVPGDPAVLPAALEVDAPRPDVDAGLDAHRLGRPQQDVEADGVDLVVVEDVLQPVGRLVRAGRVAHDHVDERVHALESAGDVVGVVDRARDVLHEVAVLRRPDVEDAQFVLLGR